jgi:CheY-like chemotaxis protein
MTQVGLLEDNTRIAHLCATMLQYAGYRVTVYEHPRACLSALLPPSTIYKPSDYNWQAQRPLPVDVLVLDLHLPDIDGMEVLRALCSHPRTASLPLIFCTAAAPAEIAYALRVAPHATLIEKPFTFNELTSAIANALKAPVG